MKHFLATLLVVLISLLLPAASRAGVVIQDVTTDRALYAPGEVVRITVDLYNATSAPVDHAVLRLDCRHLDRGLASPAPQGFSLAPAATTRLTFRWTPPHQDFEGYGVYVTAVEPAGRALDTMATAVDVSSTWTRFPRCGFLSIFPVQSTAVSRQEVAELKDFHINSLQFYDWEYKHDVPLAGSVAEPAASWKEVAGRTNSRKTILDMISAGHSEGMAALNYNLLYGAWSDYSADGVDYHWGLWRKANGTDQDSYPLPAGWSTPAIYLFDPANPGWRDFLLRQEKNAFAAYPFDGWQIDQLGDQGAVYTWYGRPADLAATLATFLNDAKSALRKQIVFNAVGGYCMAEAAGDSSEDASYIECWEANGQRTYADLKSTIDQSDSVSRGKKRAILAAYMDTAHSAEFSNAHPGAFNGPGVLLTDATIIASGGDHIELGDGRQMTSTDYFPNWSLAPSASLLSSMRKYYDFMVAYENVLRGGLRNVANEIDLSGAPESASAAPGAVWTFAKAGSGYQTIQLINLVGEKSNAWRDTNADQPAPTPLAGLGVTYHLSAGHVARVDWASPDVDDGRSHKLAFTAGADSRGRYVRFTLPSLSYWDMVYLTMR